MFRMKVLGMVGLLAIGGACADPMPSTAPETGDPAAAPPDGRRPTLIGEEVEYPLHYYGDESDNWPYITPLSGSYVEIVAADQTPQPYDNDAKVRVCPNEAYVGRNAHLRMNYRLETLDFDFRGPFTFVRHVSTTSPYPTALYIFNRNAYTRNNKYYAPAGNNVLLACDGRYVARGNVIRLWVGHLHGKLYNGPIVLNPNYDECEDGGGGGGTELMHVVDPGYDPYDSSPAIAEGGGGGCGTTPETESGGSTTTGTGTQYEPGDSTDGETVDWGTGQGNGGTSACGDAAIVDYVCIDIWDGTTWVEWGCGYVTTC